MGGHVQSAFGRLFNMLGALIADAKMAGVFDGPAARTDPGVKLSFEVYHRNHPNPPKERLERELASSKWRRERDSNPRNLSVLRFSRPVQ